MSALITREGLERLDAALAWIEEHPEQHNQNSWFYRVGTAECGTTCCLAGVVVQQAGAVPVWPDRSHYTSRVTFDGEERYTPELAAELLDIGEEATQELFQDAANAEDLYEIRDRLAASLDGDSAILGRSE